MFHGYDFDTTMLRISAMNLIMHGVEAPDIHYQDTMSQSFSTNFPQASKNAFNLILAKPAVYRFTGRGRYRLHAVGSGENQKPNYYSRRVFCKC